MNTSIMVANAVKLLYTDPGPNCWATVSSTAQCFLIGSWPSISIVAALLNLLLAFFCLYCYSFATNDL